MLPLTSCAAAMAGRSSAIANTDQMDRNRIDHPPTLEILNCATGVTVRLCEYKIGCSHTVTSVTSVTQFID
jgi:hypothetical protein